MNDTELAGCVAIAVASIAWVATILARKTAQWRVQRIMRQLDAPPMHAAATQIGLAQRRRESRASAAASALLGLSAALAGAIIVNPDPWRFGTLAPRSIALWFALAAITIGLAVTWLRSARQTRSLARAGAARHVVAQHLARLDMGRQRIHHDIAIAGSPPIDHVVVARRGVFAMYTLMPTNPRHNHLHIDDGHVRFGEGDQSVSLSAIRQRSARFQHWVSKPLGRVIPVRSVIVVVGCATIDSGPALDDLMIVKASDVVMLGGWRNAQAELLDEDVAAIDQQLCALHTAAARQRQ